MTSKAIQAGRGRINNLNLAETKKIKYGNDELRRN